MTPEDTNQLLAKERASQYAPEPKYRPGEVGSMFAFGAVLLIILISTYAGIDRQKSALVEGVVVLISFGLPFWYVRNQRQKHLDAVAQELAKIEGAKNKRQR
jgi:Flp pilus assembly protein TadB